MTNITSDNKEDVGDEAEQDYPDGETSEDRAATNFDLLQELLFPILWSGLENLVLIVDVIITWRMESSCRFSRTLNRWHWH